MDDQLQRSGAGMDGGSTSSGGSTTSGTSSGTSGTNSSTSSGGSGSTSSSSGGDAGAKTGLFGVHFHHDRREARPGGESNWQTAVGRSVESKKWYGGQSDGSGSTANFPIAADSEMQPCLDLGLTCFLCYRPAYNPTTQADYDALKASLTALKALGPKAKIILYQEIELQGSLTPAQYFNALSFYAGAIVSCKVYPHELFHDASASGSAQWSPPSSLLRPPPT